MVVLRRVRRPLKLPFKVAQEKLASPFQAAARRFSLSDLGPTVYGLRHGGASEDKARGDRTLREIQQRGAWQTFSPVLRYQKSGRLSVQMGKLKPAQQKALLANEHAAKKFVVKRFGALCRSPAPGRAFTVSSSSSSLAPPACPSSWKAAALEPSDSTPSSTPPSTLLTARRLTRSVAGWQLESWQQSGQVCPATPSLPRGVAKVEADGRGR